MIVCFRSETGIRPWPFGIRGTGFARFRVSKPVARNLPRGYGWLADQARRAAGSIPLNIAEGLGRPSRAERRRFFEIAIGSAHELEACLEVGHRLGILPEARFRVLWDVCDHVTRMLGKLIAGG